ncbi:peroxiredoxin [Candidatus Thioglobus sp.]|nr:peroxiredoxin [Candidatus Thioglobus sp.]MDB9829084.1 peroxiredoxin [Candidatus Thioglobus sp.]MDC0388764.1 peroxiredoxin [Candidatus Thioglobus sp.]MDC0904097.1 peroxiredoxin [Candidatus Thioglobus sp.]MDC0920078.1 peroxiredoxin [Candidatus Thioglobus sp.]
MNKVKSINCKATSNLDISIPDAKRRNIVLYFYPKDATSGCTLEGQDFRDNHQAFVDANCVIYGVSKDSMASHEQFKKDQSFPFELIADEDGTLCEAFGIWQLKPGNGEQKIGIVRSTFIINANGDILKSWDKVAVGGHVEAVLAEVQSL